MALPAVPFACALAAFFVNRRVAAALGIAGAAVSLALAIALAATVDTTAERSWQWVDLGGLNVTLGTRLEPTTTLVAVAVGVVALAVQVYSVPYLAGDDRYPPYAAQVSLFTAAMLLVVVAGDLILLLVGWEVMGICSYLLIGHDRRLPAAPAAAVKAFLVTRVGDVGFLLGIALLGTAAGSFRISDVLAAAATGPGNGPAGIGGGTLTAAAVLLLAGVAGKSAQFPLHTWLPDAMAGPTPISALIHAATMVAAGVYVVARLFPVFQGGDALPVLGVMAAVTMLLGALAATAQDDIKRVLAWSTVSQLGYMTGALAVGAPGVALFHLLTHAAFKALLFLAAGSVIHAVGTNSMAAMGGLRHRMPVTFWCLTIGLGALVGLPPLAGFWSKDAILAAAGESGWLLFSVGLLTVAGTAWYAVRLWLLVFFGRPRTEVHPHEPPAAMGVPVLVLAVPSAGLGLAVFIPAFRERFGIGAVHIDAAVLPPLAALAVGALTVWALWRRAPRTDPAFSLGPLRAAFANAFWVDAVQHALVVRPVRALAGAVRAADESVVDGAVEATGRGARALGGSLATAHRSGLPRAATAVLAGAVLAALAATVLGIAL
nr:NADH-quinone oxidoreductase subunit L [Micromonospora sp. NBRC 107566]